MKILLIQPPIQDFYDTDVRLQPLGLCMLKAVLKKLLSAQTNRGGNEVCRLPGRSVDLLL